MHLRIGFDMDGVLADFASEFRDYGTRLFGPGEAPSTHIGNRRLPGDQPETEEARQATAEQQARVAGRHEARAIVERLKWA